MDQQLRTNIIFDTKLKAFITKFQKENPNIMTVLEVGNQRHITNIQEDMRQWFFENKKDLTMDYKKIRKTKKSKANTLPKPDNFSLAACVIYGDINGCESWEDVFGDHANKNFGCKIGEWEPDNTYREQCVCSHHISSDNAYCIESRMSPYKMWVGCRCITNKNIVSSQDMAAMNDEMKRRIKEKKKIIGAKENEETNYPRCVDCWRKKKPDAHKPRCISCWKKTRV
jgi:hypothetical protein